MMVKCGGIIRIKGEVSEVFGRKQYCVKRFKVGYRQTLCQWKNKEGVKRVREFQDQSYVFEDVEDGGELLLFQLDLISMIIVFFLNRRNFDGVLVRVLYDYLGLKIFVYYRLIKSSQYIVVIFVLLKFFWLLCFSIWVSNLIKVGVG